MRDTREERDASDMVTSLLRHALPHHVPSSYCFQEKDASYCPSFPFIRHRNPMTEGSQETALG